MNYLEFHKQWARFGYFSIQQVYAWCPAFNRHNLRNWENQGFIVRLRKEFYAFTENKASPDFARYLANRIYRPSYLSLHTALSFYGMIPESVVQFTSVTALKTASFKNDFGEYYYHSVKPSLMFGYIPKMMNDGRAVLFATPEKALVDLLYLYPFYITEQDMEELRLDEDFMVDEFDRSRFMGYIDTINNKALASRATTLLKTYGI